MEKRINWILTIVISVLLSSGIVLTIIYLSPSFITKVVNEEVVTVNDSGISKGVKKVYDSVVAVSTYSNDEAISIGTGFVYKTDNQKGYIMTNHHVISNGEKITVTFSDDKEVEATLIGSDEYADIAILSVDKSNIIEVASIGSSEKTNVGDTIFTIGTPISLEYSGTVTRGILSNKSRLVEVSINGYSTDWTMNVMQIDAAINPGNSGGPLCNVNGEVIGINSLKIVKEEVEGIGFSIPIEDAIEYANQIITGGKVNRPQLGVSILPSSATYQLDRLGIKNNSARGVVIVEVLDNSIAKKYGLQVGDVIEKINQDKTPTIAKFRYYLYKYKSGETINLIVNRSGKSMALKVTLD